MFFRARKPHRFNVFIDDESVAVLARWNKRAKNFVLRIDPHDGSLKVTLPRGARLAEAERFVMERYHWITENRMAEHREPPLADGSILLFEGVSHRVRFLNTGTRKIYIAQINNPPEIIVGGPDGHAAARLVRWLKKQARETLTTAAMGHADTLGLDFKAIRIGDTKSRWGSCSSKGNLNFSWRLIMAPPEVLSYVAAHEVAHLREMNHSPAFWHEVERCVPNWKPLRKWLHDNGALLLAQARLK